MGGKAEKIGTQILRLLCTAVLLAGMAGCSSRAVETKVATSPHREAAPYRIAKDDQLDVIVWKEPQLSGKIRVVGDGTITIPLVGAVQAEGLTCDQLQADLTKRLSQYTHDPNVTVRVVSSAKQFYVLGEVRKPGAYHLRSDEVLSQAIAEAGGFSDFADTSAIRIVRRTSDQSSTITVNYKQIARGEDLSADIPLEAGDTITVP